MPGPKLWPVLAGIVLFPLLQYGVALRSSNLLLVMVSLFAAYLLGIYLYRAITALVCAGRVWPVIASAVGAVAVGAAVCPLEQSQMMMANTAMIPLAAVLVGRRARIDKSQLRLYLVGLATVVLGGLVMFVTQWSDLMRMAQLVGQESVIELKNSMVTLGYHADAAEEYGHQFQQVLSASVRVIPAAMIMNLVTQFSVGFLWFLLRPGPVGLAAGRLQPFKRWKVPFGLTPLLLVAVSGRLVGGETITLAADNILLALSIYYCVGGLALVEHALGRMRMPLVVRVGFYIVLTLIGVIGYVLTELLGFIDSFADWRKVARGSIELEKN